jgi:hypothetical protein
MWIDVAKLIHDQVPDKNGKTLPSDLTTGSYHFVDLGDSGVGSLFEGKVIYDKTYGHVSYGCAACCAILNTYLSYDPFYTILGPGYTNGVDGRDDCGYIDNLNGDFYNWDTANHAIATTTLIGTHTGISIGGTTSSTYGNVVKTNGRNACILVKQTPSGPTNVEPCPTTMAVYATTPFSLPNSTVLTPPNYSGIGIVASMAVGPAAQNYYGVKVTESVSRSGGTCNTTQPLCNGSSTFTVATGQQIWGQTFPAVPNQFYDNHGITATGNLLQAFNQTSCTVVCSQSYSCGGSVIGNFTITYSLNPGTANGYAVTQVTATKQ